MVALTSGTFGPKVDVLLDRGVGQLGDEVALPVAADALGEDGVEGSVERGVRHRADHLGHHRRQVAERLHGVLALLERSGPVDDRRAERVAVAVRRDEFERRGDLERGERAVGLVGGRDELAEEAQEVPGLVDLVEEQPDVDVLHGMQLELERGDHTEVAAAAAQRPEQSRDARWRWR